LTSVDHAGGPQLARLVRLGRVWATPGDRIANAQTLDRTGLIAYFASMGWIADLPDEERLPLLGAVRSQLTANEYRRNWRTDIYWTRLLPTSA
jgi:hypothetical protein